MSSPKSAKIKSKMDIWSVMLILSLLATLLACILLWLELTRYGAAPWWIAS